MKITPIVSTVETETIGTRPHEWIDDDQDYLVDFEQEIRDYHEPPGETIVRRARV